MYLCSRVVAVEPVVAGSPTVSGRSDRRQRGDELMFSPLSFTERDDLIGLLALPVADLADELVSFRLQRIPLSRTPPTT